MINMDAYLIEFVSQNWLSLTVFLTALKGLSKITPWAWDDTIASLLFGVFTSIRERGINERKINEKA